MGKRLKCFLAAMLSIVLVCSLVSINSVSAIANEDPLQTTEIEGSSDPVDTQEEQPSTPVQEDEEQEAEQTQQEEVQAQAPTKRKAPGTQSNLSYSSLELMCLTNESSYSAYKPSSLVAYLVQDGEVIAKTANFTDLNSSKRWNDTDEVLPTTGYQKSISGDGYQVVFVSDSPYFEVLDSTSWGTSDYNRVFVEITRETQKATLNISMDNKTTRTDFGEATAILQVSSDSGRTWQDIDSKTVSIPSDTSTSKVEWTDLDAVNEAGDDVIYQIVVDGIADGVVISNNKENTDDRTSYSGQSLSL